MRQHASSPAAPCEQLRSDLTTHVSLIINSLTLVEEVIEQERFKVRSLFICLRDITEEDRLL